MRLKDFLNESYTAYHAAANVCRYLDENGFVRLTLGEKWNLSLNGKYYITRNGSSVIAFKIGKNKVFNICESHTDSPSLKIKGGRIVEGDLKRLNVEQYGGGLLYSFLDRPLKIAGRILTETPDGLKQELVVSDYNVVIPSLAIHHNPNANSNLSLNPQTDMLPIWSQSETDLYGSLTDEKVIDADLYVVPDCRSFESGAKGEFLSSSRLDNLTSVYSSVTALVNCSASDIAVAACLDNEEIGSGTRQGSPEFISQALTAICCALNMNETEILSAKENGLVLSVDNGHAFHPAHNEKADPVNKTSLNGGVVIKRHPNYATDGLSAAVLKKLLQTNNVKYQEYFNRSDVRCGSTLGLVTSKTLGMKTCDIGIAMLAMHSACETCGARDVDVMTQCLTAFLSSEIYLNENDLKVK